jgi:hypothetical protein
MVSGLRLEERLDGVANFRL